MTAQWTQPVSADTARLLIPLDKLLQLPDGASFSQKEGRSHVKASVSKDRESGKPIIQIEASCDSLEQRLWWYCERNDSLMRQIDWLQRMQQQSSLDNEENTTKDAHAGLWSLIRLLAAVLVSIVLLRAMGYFLDKCKQKK